MCDGSVRTPGDISSVCVSSNMFFFKACRHFQVFLKQPKQSIFQGKLDHLEFCLCRLKKVF